MNIIELAKEAGGTQGMDCLWRFIQPELERFAALVRADVMKQVMAVCETEYQNYDELVIEDDMGHEECVALIHLMRKLEKLK